MNTHRELDTIQRLYHSIVNGDYVGLKDILESGFDPNFKIQGVPLLMISCYHSFQSTDLSRIKMDRLLIRYGANPLIRDYKGHNAIDLLLCEEPAHFYSPSFFEDFSHSTGNNNLIHSINNEEKLYHMT